MDRPFEVWRETHKLPRLAHKSAPISLRDEMHDTTSRLFLASAGGPAGEASLRRLLRDGADFGRALDLAAREGVAGPIARLIRAVGGVILDATALDRLRELERAPAFRMRFLEQRLGDALRVLDGAGIDVLVMGGAALGFTSYGSFADMALGEVELLVRTDDVVQEAQARLVEHGWRRAESRGGLVDTKAAALEIKLNIAHALFGGRHHPFVFAAADVWSRAEHRLPLPPRARVPGRVDRMLLACIDFAWGRGLRLERWRGVRDVAVILAEGPFDWPELVALAARTRSRVSCHKALSLARAYADQPIPDAVLAQLRLPWWRRWRDA